MADPQPPGTLRRRILWRLAAEFPDADLDAIETADLRSFLTQHWGDKSAATRANGR